MDNILGTFGFFQPSVDQFYVNLFECLCFPIVFKVQLSALHLSVKLIGKVFKCYHCHASNVENNYLMICRIKLLYTVLAVNNYLQ